MTSETVGAVVGGIAVAGVFGLLMILAWQLLLTWRTKIGATRELAREQAYQQLTRELASVQTRTLEGLEAASEKLGALESRTDEIARLLKEVS